jgi:hypothetical protein
MCVTFCHRRGVLYWNHASCAVETCDLARGPHGRCETCRHCQADICRATNAPLPDGGCCHWNVALVQGRVEITPAMLELLGSGSGETMDQVLERWEVPHHQLGPLVQVWIDPDELGIPAVYGMGTETVGVEAWPW